jgi:hypothetical protein
MSRCSSEPVTLTSCRSVERKLAAIRRIDIARHRLATYPFDGGN